MKEQKISQTPRPADYIKPRGFDTTVPYSPPLKDDDPRLRFMLIKISATCFAINFVAGTAQNTAWCFKRSRKRRKKRSPVLNSRLRNVTSLLTLVNVTVTI